MSLAKPTDTVANAFADRQRGIVVQIAPVRQPVPFDVVFENLGGPFAVSVSGGFETSGVKIHRLGTSAEPIRMPFFSDRDPSTATYRLIGAVQHARRGR